MKRNSWKKASSRAIKCRKFLCYRVLRAAQGIKEASLNACPILSLFEDIPCHYDGKRCRVSWFCRILPSWSRTQYFSLHLENKNLSMMVLKIDHWDKCFERFGRTGFNCVSWTEQCCTERMQRRMAGRTGAVCRHLTPTLSVLIPEQVLPGESLVVRYLVLCLAPLCLSLDVLSLAGTSDWTQPLPVFHSLQNVSHHAYI